MSAERVFASMLSQENQATAKQAFGFQSHMLTSKPSAQQTSERGARVCEYVLPRKPSDCEAESILRCKSLQKIIDNEQKLVYTNFCKC